LQDERAKLLQAHYAGAVPVDLLTVSGPFTVDLLGPEPDVQLFATWLKHALDDIGIGGHTAAGYGYATLRREPPPWITPST